MNATKAMTLLAAVAVGLSAQALTLAVKDVKIAQRYPWNGFVDIDYTVECDDPNADIYIYPIGYDVDMDCSVSPRTLTGDGTDGKAVKAGTHRMTWDMSADMGEKYSCARFTMKIHAFAGAAPYMVVDLSAGSSADKYDVSYLNGVPENGWGREYKTTNLVLRLIPPGTFWMGSRDDELGRNIAWGPQSDRTGEYETRHKVTLTQPFYMGVFELTQKQYELITGEKPAKYKGDCRPVESVKWDVLRGTTLGYNWPEHRQVDATSFFGLLRSRTGMTFDLPTEAQWEYACRAGTGTSLNTGKDISAVDQCAEMDEAGRYWWNRNDGKGGYSEHTEVGLYKPNSWGLYDMHGNVSEWCLDWWQKTISTDAVVDPVGPGRTLYYRLMRGGNFGGAEWIGSSAAKCRSAFRDYYLAYDSNLECSYPDRGYPAWGFRVVAIPAAQ